MICLTCKNPAEVKVEEHRKEVTCKYAPFRDSILEKCPYYSSKSKNGIVKSLYLIFTFQRTYRSFYDRKHKFTPFYKQVLVEDKRDED